MKEITIGRNPNDNDIVINDPLVTRYHHLTLIQDDNGRFCAIDMNSSNGTFINGQRLRGKTYICPNDVIRIGNTTLPWMNYFRSGTPTCGRKPVNDNTNNGNSNNNKNTNENNIVVNFPGPDSFHQPKIVKSKASAAILCFFLGCLGIHRFYLGYTGIGVLELLTFGCCGILSLIDFIRILTGSLKPFNGVYDSE